MMINGKIKIDGKEFAVRVDMDSDLFSDEPLNEKLSNRIVVPETKKEFYVTDLYDLLSNCKTLEFSKQ